MPQRCTWAESDPLRHAPFFVVVLAKERITFRPCAALRHWVGSPVAFHAIQTVGIVPPSMTYSVPVMEEARSDAKNAVADALVDVAPAGRHSFSDPPESI